MTRKLLWPVFAGVLVTMTAVPSRAQDVLTVEQAIEEALARNASLQAASAGVVESEARITAARAGWFPRVSVAETWQRGDQPVFVFSSLLAARRFGAANFAIDALNHPDPVGFFRTSVGIDQMLFDGGRQRAAVDAGRAQRDVARSALDEARARLAVQVAEVYGQILAADAGERAAASALDTARQDRASAAARRDAGVATDADVLALDAYVAALDQRRIQHEGDGSIARATLNRLLGSPVTRTYQLIAPPPPPLDGSASVDVDALLKEAEANRPEIRRAAAALRVADSERQGAVASWMPQVGAQAAFDVSGTTFSTRASSWIVGADARWSLSLGGAERARVKAASAARMRAQADADDARAAVHVDVVTALRRHRSAAARVESGRTAREQARESARIVRDRVDAGLATITDLLRASTAVLDADAQWTAATVDLLVGEAQLQRALGRHP